MRQQIINIYKFGELSQGAQAKVLEKCRNWEVEVSDWYEGVYEWFIENMQGMYGLELDSKDIEFSGFYSQGDGACFSKENLNRRDIAELVETLGIEFSHKALKELFVNSLEVSINGDSRHYRTTSSVEVAYSSLADNTPKINKYLDEKAYEMEEKLDRMLADVTGDLYNKLEMEYEYLTSDECLEEMIGCNGYEFTADGEFFN